MDDFSLGLQRFSEISSDESHNRQQYLTAVKFYNGEQWPEGLRRMRETDPSGARPCLTVNVLPHYVKQVTNEMRQNRPSIKVLPVDSGADIETAKAIQGMIRHIENRSDADVVYTTAGKTAVIGGLGYWRILSRYADQERGLQELTLMRITNPLTVYMSRADDPSGADADDVYLTEMIHKDRFKELYDKQAPSSFDSGTGDDTWLDDDYVRVAEWFHCDYEYHKAVVLKDGTRQKASDIEGYQKATGKSVDYVREDQIKQNHIVWRKMSGVEILKEQRIDGKYIPVVRVVGQETDIEGKRYYYGMVRDAIDPARMRNYWRSCETEMIALAPKAPFIGAAGQFDGFEDRWGRANVSTEPYLEYNAVGVDGNQIPAPQRQPATPIPNAIVQAAQNADFDIKAATGIFGAGLGEPSREHSGKAIIARKSESDTSTFDYIDNLSVAVRHTGRILVDLIPYTYDTPRIQRILGEDGVAKMMQLDPNHQGPPLDIRTNQYEGVFNPGVGQYDVEVATGPSYTTKRQEAAESMAQILQGNPQLWQAAGDLFAMNLDWPGADVLAERLKKMVPPNLLEDDQQGQQHNPQDQAMIQQLDKTVQAMSAELEKLQSGAAVEQAKAAADKQRADADMKKLSIDAYRAETDRMTFIAQNPQSLPLLKALGMFEDVVEDPLAQDPDEMHPVVQAGIQQAAPQPPPQEIPPQPMMQ